MHRRLPMACSLLFAAALLAACSPPKPPEEERRPEPKAAASVVQAADAYKDSARAAVAASPGPRVPACCGSGRRRSPSH